MFEIRQNFAGSGGEDYPCRKMLKAGSKCASRPMPTGKSSPAIMAKGGIRV
jgi:hypothetical protein